jgi:hypothetical protein
MTKVTCRVISRRTRFFSLQRDKKFRKKARTTNIKKRGKKNKGKKEPPTK